MLMNMSDLLKTAYEHNFAIGSFNVGNSEFVRVVVESAEEQRSPAIIQIHPNELELVGEEFLAYVCEMCKKTNVPMAIHLDHGSSKADIIKAIRNGFTSVMIDASDADFKTNLAITKEIVDIAHSVNVSVEAELGTLIANEGSSEEGADALLYANADEAKTFVKETGIDTLAAAVGTAHGKYEGEQKPNIKLDLLSDIHKKVDIPLVLHGGSDNKDKEIIQTYSMGVSKINISTDMKTAFIQELRNFLNEHPEAYEPDVIMPKAREEAKTVVKNKMDLFNSTDKIDLYQLK